MAAARSQNENMRCLTRLSQKSRPDRLITEGEVRLKRSTLAVLTGLIAGLDVGFGVLAYLVVEHVTHNVLLAGLGFSLGFVALLLGRSELFTENFLVPVMTLVAGKSGPMALARLWGLTLVTNLAGGWIISWLIITARPDLKSTAVEVGSHYADLGVSGGPSHSPFSPAR